MQPHCWGSLSRHKAPACPCQNVMGVQARLRSMCGLVSSMSTVTLPPPSEISYLSLSHEPLRPPKVKHQNGKGKYNQHVWTWDWEESSQGSLQWQCPAVSHSASPSPTPTLATLSLVDLHQAEASGLTCHNSVDPWTSRATQQPLWGLSSSQSPSLGPFSDHTQEP